MVLFVRRSLGVLKFYVSQIPVHLKNKGPEQPSLLIRLVEQFALLATNAVTADDYYYLGLHRRELPWSEKRLFIGHYMLKRTYAAINSPAYRVVLNDKKIFHLLCVAQGIPVPRILASYSSRGEIAPWPSLSRLSELEAFLGQPDVDNIFMKPTDAQRGAGALALGACLAPGVWESLPSRARITIADIVNHINRHASGREWIIQQRVVPHPFTAGIVENVCSTVRIVTLNVGEPAILGAVVRFGDGDSPADNSNGGGVVSIVDIETGELGRTLHAEDGRAVFGTAHHRTGARITGLVLPCWPAIKEVAMRGALQFPYITCIGWDIAITERGPVVLEANAQSGFPSLQILSGRGLLSGPLGRLLEKNSGLARSGVSVPRCGRQGAR